MTLILDPHQFLRSVAEISPPWGATRWSLERYLEIFDAGANLRPLYRVHLPEKYAYWVAERSGITTKIKLSDTEGAHFAHLRELLFSPVVATEDTSEDGGRLWQIRAELAEYICVPSGSDTVEWEDWKAEVSNVDGRPVKQAYVISLYGAWQRLRFWALLEQYSFRALLDPRKLHPREIFEPQWDREIRGKWLSSSTGNPRINRVVELLEADQWLERLYLARDAHQLSRVRVWDPILWGWPEGESFDEDERFRIQSTWARSRCRFLGIPWLNNRAEFIKRIGLLVELWDLSCGLHASSLTQVVESDIQAAIRWITDLFSIEFNELSEEVGGSGSRGRTTLMHVLRPGWFKARATSARYVDDFIETFNDIIQVIRLDNEDKDKFLNFLDKHELWSWYVEFSQYIEEWSAPTDLAWDRKFLHLRSMVLLHEQIVVALVDEWGSDTDRERVQQGVEGSLKVFVADRKDWRSLLWQCVKAQWKLTRASTTSSLREHLEEISHVDCGIHLTGAAQTLLSFAAIRNFGSHRFSRDPDLLSDYHGQLLRAAVFTPLLYWKVATTLG